MEQFDENELDSLTAAEIRDSLDTFCSQVLTNTPYNGPIGRWAQCQYHPAHITVMRSDSLYAPPTARDEIQRRLEYANTANSFMNFIAEGSSFIQANQWFHIDETGKFVRTTGTTSAASRSFKSASDIAQVGKGIGTATSWIGVGLTVADIGNNGLNHNNGTNAVVCAVGFIPGYGWVIAGIYTIVDIIVVGITGESIADHVNNYIVKPVMEKGAEKYARFNWNLEKLFFWNQLEKFYPGITRTMRGR